MFNKPTQIALACASICTMYSAHSTAQTSLEPVVVIASGVEQPLSKVLPSASVITRADLDRSQAKTLVDALQGEPGFEFGRNGGPGGTTSIFLRGSDSKNIVVMIDGVRSQTDNLGSLQITDIPLSAVERIEILRGNAGALYGESAIGGVINIITKSGKGDPKANANLTYGSRNTSETAIGYSGEVNQTRFAINASRFDTDGFSAKKVGASNNPDRDGYTNEAFLARIGHKLNSQTEFGLNAQATRANTAFDGGVSWVAGSNRDSDAFRTSNDSLTLYGSTYLLSHLKTRLDISWSNFTYKDFRNGTLRPAAGFWADGLQTGRQTTYRLSNLYEIDDSHQITFGVDKSDTFYDLVFNTNTSNVRESIGAYLGTLKKIGPLDVQANLRRDELDAYRVGSRINEYAKNTYLLGVGYQLNPLYRLTATTSTGFRAPAPYEFTAASSLKPETNKSNEVGVQYLDAVSSLRLVYFDTQAADAIYYNPVNDRYQNMNVKNNGIELSGRRQFGNTGVKFSFTKQDPVNADVNLQQARRAQEFGSLDINHQLGQYQLGGLLYWSGTRKDSDFSQTTMPAYTVLNLYGSYKIDKEWTARLRLENIADTQYELASGYNTPGRGIFMTLQYQGR